MHATPRAAVGDSVGQAGHTVCHRLGTKSNVCGRACKTAPPCVRSSDRHASLPEGWDCLHTVVLLLDGPTAHMLSFEGPLKAWSAFCAELRPRCALGGAPFGVRAFSGGGGGSSRTVGCCQCGAGLPQGLRCTPQLRGLYAPAETLPRKPCLLSQQIGVFRGRVHLLLCTGCRMALGAAWMSPLASNSACRARSLLRTHGCQMLDMAG